MLEYFYDHLKTNEDMEKVRSITAQKMVQFLGVYLIRKDMLGPSLFEDSDLCA